MSRSDGRAHPPPLAALWSAPGPAGRPAGAGPAPGRYADRRRRSYWRCAGNAGALGYPTAVLPCYQASHASTVATAASRIVIPCVSTGPHLLPPTRYVGREGQRADGRLAAARQRVMALGVEVDDPPRERLDRPAWRPVQTPGAVLAPAGDADNHDGDDRSDCESDGGDQENEYHRPSISAPGEAPCVPAAPAGRPAMTLGRDGRGLHEGRPQECPQLQGVGERGSG